MVLLALTPEQRLIRRFTQERVAERIPELIVSDWILIEDVGVLRVCSIHSSTKQKSVKRRFPNSSPEAISCNNSAVHSLPSVAPELDDLFRSTEFV